MDEVMVAVKIIGERDNREKKRVFFNSLNEALRAFLQGEIYQLTIKGRDVSFWFSGRNVGFESIEEGEFEENLIDAPVVLLKLLSHNKAMTEFPQFTSLLKGFGAFFEKKVSGFQIYEQKRQTTSSALFEIRTNYMIVFGWDSGDSQKILLHLHNVEVPDNHFWRRDFHSRHQGWKEDSFCFIPAFGPRYKLAASISQN